MKQKRMMRKTAPLITPCASGLKGRYGGESARPTAVAVPGPAPVRPGSAGQRYLHGPPRGLVEVFAEEPRGEEVVLEGRDQRDRGQEAQQRPAEIDEEGSGGPGRHGHGGRCPGQGHRAGPGARHRPPDARASSGLPARAAPSLALARAACPAGAGLCSDGDRGR